MKFPRFFVRCVNFVNFHGHLLQVTNVDGEPMFSVMFKQKPNQFSPVDIATVLYRKMMGKFTVWLLIAT